MNRLSLICIKAELFYLTIPFTLKCILKRKISVPFSHWWDVCNNLTEMHCASQKEVTTFICLMSRYIRFQDGNCVFRFLQY